MAVAFISFFVVFVVLRSVTNVRRTSLALGASSAMTRQRRTNNSIEEGNWSTKLQLNDSFLTQDLTLKWQKTNNSIVQPSDSADDDLPEVQLSEDDLPEVQLSLSNSVSNSLETLQQLMFNRSLSRNRSRSRKLQRSESLSHLPKLMSNISVESNSDDFLDLHIPRDRRVTLMCTDESVTFLNIIFEDIHFSQKVDFEGITELTGGVNAHTVSAIESDTSQLVVLKVPKFGKIVQKFGKIMDELSKTVLVSHLVSETVKKTKIDLKAVQVDRVCQGQQPYKTPFNEEERILVITPYVDQKVDCCPEDDKGSEASKHMFEAFLAFHVALDSIGYMDWDHSLDPAKNVFCRIREGEKKEMMIPPQSKPTSHGILVQKGRLPKEMMMYDFDQVQRQGGMMFQVYGEIKKAFDRCHGERTSDNISDLATKLGANEAFIKGLERVF